MSYYVAFLESGTWVCPKSGLYCVTLRGGSGPDGTLGQQVVEIVDCIAGGVVAVQIGSGGYATIEDCIGIIEQHEAREADNTDSPSP